MGDVVIYVVGPEGSGTHMLTGLIRALGVEAEQRSLPYAGTWWISADGDVFDPATGGPYPEGTRFVAIVRGERYTVASVMRRSLAPSPAHALDARTIALARLSVLPRIVRSYEAIVADPVAEMADLAALLGVPPASVLPDVQDANRKWDEIPVPS